jgi:SAM-dependent methyltransferase
MKKVNFEDHFSESAASYAQSRPLYPGELFEYLASIAPSKRLAWDCGTGNGQAAQELVCHFEHVLATDASADQIAHVTQHERIEYRVERAEDVKLESHSVDLITVATAVHWFDLEPFYRVVRRVARKNGILAVWMYHLASVDPAIDRIVEHYYRDLVKDFWPERFHYLANRYQTLPFPFEEIEPPQFIMQAEWDLEQLEGFLDSWSATRRYAKEYGRNPINHIWQDLVEAWGKPGLRRTVRWPLYLRVGRIGLNSKST